MSNFALRFIGVQGKESSIFVNLAPQKPKIGRRIGQRAHSTINRTGRSLDSLRRPRLTEVRAQTNRPNIFIIGLRVRATFYL